MQGWEELVQLELLVKAQLGAAPIKPLQLGDALRCAIGQRVGFFLPQMGGQGGWRVDEGR